MTSLRAAWTTGLLLGWLAFCPPRVAPAAPAAGPLHWSLRPPVDSPVPQVKDTAWPRGSLDQFVLARLEAAGLSPAPEADRGTLIRRLSFDLTGLPPGPAEIDAFVNDPGPGAYEKLVDRLLASPHYGERWGRHWLDVARYTESQGFEYDRLRDRAWHYRDYVIESFNKDKPYNRFVIEQIAGDVMEPVTAEGIIATSLLVCGPWDETIKIQANATLRALSLEEEKEELVSVVSQGFLGLTVNCSRCHDHKFDPIPQADYYRVKAVFDGVQHGERVIASADETKARDARVAALDAEIALLETRLLALEAKARAAAKANGPAEAGEARAGAGPAVVPLLRWNFEDEAAPPGTLEGGATVDGGRLNLNGSGAFFKSAPIPKDVTAKTLEAWMVLSDLDQGGGAAISLETPGGAVFDAIVFGERQPRKWVAGSSGYERTRDLSAPQEDAAAGAGVVHVAITYRDDNTIAVYRNGLPYGGAYKPAAAVPTFKAGAAHVLLGMRHTGGGGKAFLGGQILRAHLYDRALSDAEVAASSRAAGATLSRDELLACMTGDERAAFAAAAARLAEVQANLKSVPPPPMSYAGSRQQPAPTRRLKRGDVTTPAELVAPAGLSAVAEPSPDFGLAPDAPEAQRRLKFAQWVADPRNPLTARVMANRVWHYHFGQGIVATPNDLGATGAKPSHPELLDWLAVRFVDAGWSVKALHKLIVCSATYRQSSQFNPAAAAIDADNGLLWRYAPRRLEAEAVRDGMLAASGQINLQLGGPSYRPFDVVKFPLNAYVLADKIGPEYNRRTVYRMNVNSGKEPLLDAFDCPDPAAKTPRRGVTTTPIQALGLMNGSFVRRQAKDLAERAMGEAGGDVDRAIGWCYRHALGRAATAEELERAGEVVRRRGLENVCWALLNSTEFVYVR